MFLNNFFVSVSFSRYIFSKLHTKTNVGLHVVKIVDQNKKQNKQIHLNIVVSTPASFSSGPWFEIQPHN
jgi:hypothetical protein